MIFCGATFTVAGLLYGVLHVTYPAERRRARQAAVENTQAKAPLLKSHA